MQTRPSQRAPARWPHQHIHLQLLCAAPAGHTSPSSLPRLHQSPRPLVKALSSKSWVHTVVTGGGRAHRRGQVLGSRGLLGSWMHTARSRCVCARAPSRRVSACLPHENKQNSPLLPTRVPWRFHTAAASPRFPHTAFLVARFSCRRLVLLPHEARHALQPLLDPHAVLHHALQGVAQLALDTRQVGLARPACE